MIEEQNEELEMMRRIHEAFENSYRVVIKHQNPYTQIEEMGDVVYAHDIQAPLGVQDVKSMIKYWETIEEYERCAELKNLENEITRLSSSNKKSSLRDTCSA